MTGGLEPNARKLAPSRRLVVLGGEGYVGAVLVKNAASFNFELVQVDAGWFRNVVSETEGRTDIRDLDEGFFKPNDTVINLAAVSNDPMGKEFGAATLSINRDGAVSVAELARKAGAALYVFASSASVYGAFDAGEFAAETSPLRPQTAYALSKAEAEGRLASLADENFQVVALRFATAMGSSDNLRLDLAVNDFVASALRHGEVRLQSSGEAHRPFISVQDMAFAILTVVERHQKIPHPFEIFNVVAEGWNYSIIDAATQVAGALDVPVSMKAGSLEDRRNYSMSHEKWHEQFPDWKPRLSFGACVRELAEQLVALEIPSKSNVSGSLRHFNRLASLRSSVSGGDLSSDLRWGLEIKARGAGRSNQLPSDL